MSQRQENTTSDKKEGRDFDISFLMIMAAATLIGVVAGNGITGDFPRGTLMMVGVLVGTGGLTGMTRFIIRQELGKYERE